MEIFKRLSTFIKKNYWIFLLVVVLISYGQLIFMLPWQDDNAVFFKLANIAGAAGYLGKGPFGEGAYKYTVTPYIPIFKFFGYNPVPYFVLAIICYFFAAYVIYKIFSSILGKTPGRLAGFLFAAGYEASDGFIRLYNTVTTSFSIIFISALVYCYWNFYKKKNYYWYFGSLFFYYLATEFAKARTQYLISVIVIFEVIFLAFKKPIYKSIAASFFRILPFLYIFYRYFVLNPDGRSGQIFSFVTGIVHGQFYLFYGFLSALTNIVIPDWIGKPGWVSGFILCVFAFYILTRKSKKSFIKFIFFSILSFFWLFAARYIFSTTILNLSSAEKIAAYLGGEIVLFFICIYFLLENYSKKLYLFFGLWVVFGVLAYAVYDPTITYVTIQRYLVHSYFAFIILLCVLFFVLKNKKSLFSKIGIVVVVLWGVGNLISAFSYQNRIVQNRSNPVKNFYSQLSSYLPKINKGDILYFDVADNARGYFADAFSVAQMPNETAIAWRYGVDRYDFRMATSFDELTALLKTGTVEDINNNAIKIGKVYGFYYSKDGLIDTTNDLSAIFKNDAKPVDIPFKQDGQEIVFNDPINSVTPSVLKINMKVRLPDVSRVTFPYLNNASMSKNKIANNSELRTLAFKYQTFVENLRKTMRVSTTSEWRQNIHQYLIDGDVNTVWQSDRVSWPNGNESLTLDLGKIYEIDRFVWKNAYENHSPTDYTLDVSVDGKKWNSVNKINNVNRISTVDFQVISFLSQNARFVRMNLVKSLDGDSPGISEVWAVPSDFDQLDINEVENFLEMPFGYVPDKNSFNQTLTYLGYKGSVDVNWMSNDSGQWLSQDNSRIILYYRNLIQEYSVSIPASGTKISRIKFANDEIPGTYEVLSVKQFKPILKNL